MMFEDYVTAIPSISPVFSFVLLNVMIGMIAFASKLANQTKHSINKQEHSQNHQNYSQNHHHHQQQQQQFQQNKQNWLARSPSIILERVRSINLSSYRSQEPNSATNFNLEHTQKHENSSHYIFEQSHQENEHVASNNSHQNHQTTTEPQLQVESNFEHTQEKKTQKINDFSPKTDEFELNHENAEHLEEEQEEEQDGDDELQSLDELHTNLNTTAGKHIMRTKSDAEPYSGEAIPKLPRKMRKSASMQSPFMHFEAEDIVEEIRRPETMREMENGVDEKADDFINMFRNQLKLQRMDSIIRYKEMITRGSEK